MFRTVDHVYPELTLVFWLLLLVVFGRESRPMIINKNKMFAPCLCKFRVLDRISTVHYDDDM